MCHPFFASAILPQPTRHADFPSPLYGTWRALRSRKMQPLAGRNHQAALQHQGEGNEQLLIRYSMVSTHPSVMHRPTPPAPRRLMSSQAGPHHGRKKSPHRNDAGMQKSSKKTLRYSAASSVATSSASGAASSASSSASTSSMPTSRVTVALMSR